MQPTSLNGMPERIGKAIGMLIIAVIVLAMVQAILDRVF